MKTLLFALAAGVFLSGCAAKTTRYVLSKDSKLVEDGTECKSVPYGRATIPLGDRLKASVSARHTPQNVVLTFQLPMPVGAKVRLLKPEIAVEVQGAWSSQTATFEPFVVSVYGEGRHLGHRETFRPDALLEGKGRNLHLASGATGDTSHFESDLHVSQATIPATSSDSIVLVFPAAEVNGVVVAAQRIPIRLAEKPGVMACVQ